MPLSDILGMDANKIPQGQNPLSQGLAIGGGGLKQFTGAVVAAIIQVLTFLLPVYSLDSKEGEAIMSAIKKLKEVAGNANAKDIMSAIQSLVSALPSNMQGVSPLAKAIPPGLEGMLGMGGGGAGAPPPGAGAPPPGAGATPPGAGAQMPSGLQSILGG